MCGRMSLTADDHRAAAIMLSAAVPGFDPGSLAAWLERAHYQPHSNIGPGQQHWTVLGRNDRAILDRGLWGFSSRSKPGKLLFNARAEGIETRPTFRAAFERRRCLIPADGFFEWERRDGQRLPWWFHRPDRSALLFAAIIDPPEHASEPPRFSIITVPAASELARIHERMPAIVEPGEVMQWLFGPPAAVHSLLRPHGEALTCFRVSPNFNKVDYDAPIESEAA
jgi:putative SOS response-associated peptidase YedK